MLCESLSWLWAPWPGHCPVRPPARLGATLSQWEQVGTVGSLLVSVLVCRFLAPAVGPVPLCCRAAYPQRCAAAPAAPEPRPLLGASRERGGRFLPAAQLIPVGQVAAVTASSSWLGSCQARCERSLLSGAEGETETLVAAVHSDSSEHLLDTQLRGRWRRRCGDGHSPAAGKCGFSDRETPFLCWCFSSGCHSTPEISSL